MSHVSKNAICTWDFTLKAEGIDPKDVLTLMKETSKKFCFQLETGSDGYVHFQGRHTLKVRSRAPKHLWTEFLDTFNVVRLSPTLDENRDNHYYVSKSETRVDGPWKDTDKEAPRFTIQLQKHSEQPLQPWEESLLVIAQTWTMRNIEVVVAKGGEGKSLFSEYLEYKSLAYELPAYNDWKDISRVAYCVDDQTCYLIDMPRAINKTKMAGFYAGVETLKNGTVADDRYTFKKRRMDRPVIIVFTNELPQEAYLTKDRWRYWTILNKKLVKYGGKTYTDSISLDRDTPDRDDMNLLMANL